MRSENAVVHLLIHELPAYDDEVNEVVAYAPMYVSTAGSAPAFETPTPFSAQAAACGVSRSVSGKKLGIMTASTVGAAATAGAATAGCAAAAGGAAARAGAAATVATGGRAAGSAGDDAAGARDLTAAAGPPVITPPLPEAPPPGETAFVPTSLETAPVPPADSLAGGSSEPPAQPNPTASRNAGSHVRHGDRKVTADRRGW